MVLFFDETIDASEEFIFSKEESKHLAKVLRKKPGDSITLTNGKGLEWEGVLTQLNPSAVAAKKIKSIQHAPPLDELHLAIAPTKNMNRMEWLVEKLTELGVSSITPIICDYSERKIVKLPRLKKISIAALKQSQQFFLPQIHPPISFLEYLNTEIKNGYIAHCGTTDKVSLTDCHLTAQTVTLLIGPEGDFSASEIKLAEKSGLQSVSLGKQRFRTETAGLLACHTVFTQRLKN